jgi:hypothetical protein
MIVRQCGNVHSLSSHIYRKHPHRGSTLGSTSSGTTLAVGSSLAEPQNQAVADDSVAESLEHCSGEQGTMEGGDGSSIICEDIDFCFERKKKSCLLLMQLKEERMLTQTAINDVVKGCQDVVSYALSSVRSKVNDLSAHSHSDEIEAVKTAITEVFDPFAGLETSYLQDKFILKEMGCLVRSLRTHGYYVL